MLAASLPPRSTWYQKPPPPSQRRGRSRNVSAAALARQASEERRRRAVEESEKMDRRRQRRLEKQRATMSHFPPQSSPLSQVTTVALSPTTDLNDSILIAPPTSPALSNRSISPTPSPSESSSSSSISRDNYSRTPSPPRTLADRIQVAYAHDDITLAKMLLLQLKHGIEITSTTDPRIDSVKDEDFDQYFVPRGGLNLEEADARMVEEGKKKQKELCETQKRLERLRACERIWEKEKRKMREEKMRITKKREDEARRAEARRLEREEAQRQRPRLQFIQPSADHQEPGPSTRHDDERPFEYAFMQPTSITPPRRTMVSPKKREVILPSSSPHNVSFKDVVSSMHGPLFPPDHTEQSERRRSSNQSPQSHSRRRSARQELLDSLLKVVEWDEVERRRVKGKGAEQRARVPKSQLTSCAACSAASAAHSVSTSPRSSIALSRTSSWLSFGSRVSSTASISTAATTPATSPISSWLKSSAPPSLSAASERFAVQQPPLRHSCASKRLIAIPLADCPLGLPVPESKSQVDDAKTDSDGALTFNVRGRKSSTLGKRMSVGVSSLVELAKGLQSAYIATTLFSVTVGSDPCTSRAHLQSSSTTRSPPRIVKKQGDRYAGTADRTLKPIGYRVLSSDVAVFTAPSSESIMTPEIIHFIPLISPFPSQPSIPSSSRVLGAANLKFLPQPILQSSPYRPRDPPSHIVYRMRPISNPVLLRLRALQNVLVERGKEWEGRGREGGLGCGRERVLGVAFEGRGRSGLGCEVRVGVF